MQGQLQLHLGLLQWVKDDRQTGVWYNGSGHSVGGGGKYNRSFWSRLTGQNEWADLTILLARCQRRLTYIHVSVL